MTKAAELAEENRKLRNLLASIRSLMHPGYVMPVPEQAKYIVQWIDTALADERRVPNTKLPQSEGK